MARRSRGRFIRLAARTKMWIGAGLAETALTGSTKVLLHSLLVGALLLRPFTILRTRQLVSYGSDQEAADETPFGAYGQIVVTETASGIGVTAVPDPSSIDGDPEADWFVWQACANQVNFQTAVGFANQGLNEYVIDSKAMRKVGPDDEIVGMFNQEPVVGATIILQGRMLIQLH